MSAVAILATLATYVETRREIGDLFDLQLKQLAYSTRIDDLLRGRSPAPPLLRDGRRVAGVSEIVTQIWDRDGVLVYWSQPGAGLPVPVTEGYSDVVRDGHTWRVYTHVDGDHALQIAHALDERREIAAQAALRTLVPLALLIPLLGILIWYAVGRGLRPLDALSRDVQMQRPDALSPVAADATAAGAEAVGGEPQRAARAAGRGARRAAAIHGGRGARAPHAARGAGPAGRAGRPRDGRGSPRRRHGRSRGGRGARVAAGRAAADDGATRARGARTQFRARGSRRARQGSHRRARADRRREGHRPRVHGDGGRSSCRAMRRALRR